MKKRFFGIDPSKTSMEVAVVDDTPKKKETFKLKTNFEGREKLAKRLTASDTVALETGNNAFELARFLINNVGCEVFVLNASKLRIIFESSRK